jgi:hypothetical protein
MNELEEMVAIFKSNATTHDWIRTASHDWIRTASLPSSSLVVYKCKKCGSQTFTDGNLPTKYYVSCGKIMMARALE